MTEAVVYKTVVAKLRLEDILGEYPDLPGNSDAERNIALLAILKERFKGNGQRIDVQFADDQVEINWAIKKNAPEVEKLNKQAIQHARSKNFDEAIDCWRQAITRAPNDPDYRYNLGLALFESRDYARCAEQLEETVRICPPYFRAYFVLGNLYSKMRQFDKAAAKLEQGLLFQNNNINALLNLAAVYSVLRDYGKAIPLFEQCISHSPKEARAYLGLGKIYAIEGDTENANRCFKAVLKLDPEGKLGSIARKSMRSEEEINLSSGEEIENVDVLYSEGYHAYIRGEYETAIRFYKRYIAKRPKDADVLAALASSQLRAGHNADAINTIQKATSLRPNKPSLFKQAAMIYDINGRSNDALQAAQKAVELGNNDSITFTILGKSCIALGREQEGFKYLADAVKLNPNNINARFHFARLLSKMGQSDAARQQFEEVLWSKFDTPLKAKAQKELEKLLK